jgi:hypothetical protein
MIKKNGPDNIIKIFRADIYLIFQPVILKYNDSQKLWISETNRI